MENNQPPPKHETTDARTRPVWITGAALAVSCILIAFAVTWMFNVLQHRVVDADKADANRTVVPSIAGLRKEFPEPRLQVAPEVDLAALRARDDAELNHYGWIDKNAGIVRIPIERAMELTVQRGLPVQGQPGAPVPYRTTLDMQQARPLERETPAPIRTK